MGFGHWLVRHGTPDRAACSPPGTFGSPGAMTLTGIGGSTVEGWIDRAGLIQRVAPTVGPARQNAVALRLLRGTTVQIGDRIA
ncbi:hypothetical protein Nans01_19910 [Nocardiopsis ansamitocini]|uniref:Uncharacterized protein n=2 Tax=Nocardiopsis ansamitocini TaxID=1670832 RepID=A0A9W6P5M7_9ACTN|nr:hypothetical protein Nans01_19910 [Nocardiopsis ansamitocini]